MFKRNDEDATERECAFCDRVWGLIGVGAGLILIFTGLDLMTKGKLSGGISTEVDTDNALTTVPDTIEDEIEDETDDSDGE